MRNPIRIAALAGAAGVITLGGATAAFAVHSSSHEPHESTTYSTSSSVAPTASPTTSAATSAKVSQDQARQIAQQRVTGAKVAETCFDHEHGRAVWEVELTKQHREYEVTIDAVTGKVIKVGDCTDLDDCTGVEDHD
jgi:uncharacterized membrane protein YkoI